MNPRSRLRGRGPLRASLVLAVGLASGCGWDGLLLTPRGYDATEPPRAALSGIAPPRAEVQVMSRGGDLIASTTAGDSGQFVVRLPSKADPVNLRLLAKSKRGAPAMKTLVPSASVGEQIDVGRLDAASTAVALLATYSIVQQAGSSFRATPPRALLALLSRMRAQPTAELTAFAALVSELLAGADRVTAGEGAPGIFDLAGYELQVAYLAAASLGSDVAARYKTSLAAAANGYSLEIRCDPSRLNVMFAVDVSGRGLDGNGVPQLIRQPPKEARVYLGLTSDESSPLSDDAIPKKLAPNDPKYVMGDDGRNGDELAGDGIYTVVVPLPRGARILYKYTDGSAGEGFTGTEEWPGNARILEVEDVLTGRPDGEPDCLVIRRDAFGDESTNKNFVNLNQKARERGGTVSFETDLGGPEAPLGRSGARIGGLSRDAGRTQPGLTPRGVPEARENGICTVCPEPLVLDPDDMTPPVLVRADRLSIDRVRVRFSKPLKNEDARGTEHYVYRDETGRSVPIRFATPEGADVVLTVAPTHPRAPAMLHVTSLRDASVRGNLLAGADARVGADLTPPKVISARARSILDVDPRARALDPTVGDLVEIALDERPEESAAGDPTRYRIDGLEVLAAALIDDPQNDALPVAPVYRVRLVTETQAKGVPYVLRIRGLRDPAGNALDQEVPFEGFALYRVTFGLVPGFAYQDGAGAMRGIPRREKLYLTGTPLSSARGLDGRDISVTSRGATRTDVTGWPQFELKPAGQMYQDRPIHEISVLLPRGAWSWKAAHGVEGDQLRPPQTLEKVYKTLATTNDPTGVAIDPVTMVAANGVSYRGAALSESGDEPPRASVVFKREAPDEVCTVASDVRCPFIVAGAWRDFVLDPGGRTRDYDDGIITLAPIHPSLPDVSPPKLLDVRARDSFSILISFDKTIVSPSSSLEVGIERADNHYSLRAAVLPTTTEVKPHQAVLRINAIDCGEALARGVAHTLRYRGATDVRGNADRRWRTQTFLAPESCVPFSPLIDRRPPRIADVRATDLTEITVRFDKRLDPAKATLRSAYAVVDRAGAALGISAVEMLSDRASVRLGTDPQQILHSYRLTVTDLEDTIDPPNVLTSTTVPFVGFGDRIPPAVKRVRAINANQVLVRFDKPIDPVSAIDPSHYAIAGLAISAVSFSGDPGRRSLAFNAALAPRLRDAVLVTTSAMIADRSYAIAVDGVRDLSGNLAHESRPFTAVSTPPSVQVILEYQVSNTTRVAGFIPSRAISLAELSASRKGVYILGARTAPDFTPVFGQEGPVNDALGGFGVEGQPIRGLARRMRDDGVLPDLVAGDGIFTIAAPRVPLGTMLLWKAFAPYTTQYRDQNPQDSAAAFADPLPGPSVFADGQEYPGNENGAVVLDDGDSSGAVRVRCLFGDEITYKKHTGQPAYQWVVESR